MPRDGRDDPFDDLFDELERLMDEMMGAGEMDVSNASTDNAAADPTAGRDVHVSVQETDAEVRVIADIPSVDREALDLRCDGTVLTIAADTDRQRFNERIDLPTRVDEHTAEATFNNGILEVGFERREDSASINLN